MSAPMSLPGYRVWQRNGDVFLRLWRVEFWPGFIEPLFVLLAMGFGLGAFVVLGQGESYLQFIAPGLVASSAMFSSCFECTYGSFVRMSFQKTFEAILATPLGVEDIVMGEILWGSTRALVSGGPVLIILLLLGLVQSPWAVAIPLVVVLEGLMFSAISLLFTAIVPSIYTYNYFFTLFVTPQFLFSGIFFPLDRFPTIFQSLAWFAPLTHVVSMSRSLVLGKVSPDLGWDLAWIVAVTVIFSYAANMRMRRRLVQ